MSTITRLFGNRYWIEYVPEPVRYGGSIMPNGDASIDAGQQQAQTIVDNTVYFGVSAGGQYGYYLDAQGTLPIDIGAIPTGVQVLGVNPILPSTSPVPTRGINLEEEEPEVEEEKVESPASMFEITSLDDYNLKRKKMETIALGVMEKSRERNRNLRELKQDEQGLRRAKQDVIFREQELNKKKVRAYELSKKIATIKRGMPAIVSDIEGSGVLELYSMLKWENSKLFFKLKNKTYITVGYDSGVCCTYYIGKFVGNIDFVRKIVWFANTAMEEAGYPEGLNYPHPHISDGHPCFGDSMHDVSEWLEGFEFKKLLQFIPQYLSSYNAESPHKTIQSWESTVPEELKVCPVCFRYKHKYKESLLPRQLCKCVVCNKCKKQLNRCANLCDVSWIKPTVNQTLASIGRQFSDVEVEKLRKHWVELCLKSPEAEEDIASMSNRGVIQYIENVLGN